jgi:alpha-L-rhamnosidase
MSTSSRYGIRIRDPVATALTSAPWQDPAPLSFEHFQGDLTADEKTMLRKIDRVSITTLRNCMQTVFEDGPRRDRRLWSVILFIVVLIDDTQLTLLSISDRLGSATFVYKRSALTMPFKIST